MCRIARVLLLSLAVVPLAAEAQRLGKIDFPTSTTTPAAQREFETGVLYLHSFEYPSAREAFKRAAREDPGFAMAYWGEAMTFTHPVWNQQDLGGGRAALAKLGADSAGRAGRAPTERERGYLGAVEALYGAGSKPGRDSLYAARMKAVAIKLPSDDEAQLFSALALLGLSQGNRDLPTYLAAGAIAAPIFARHPEHPGAAHYVIHAYDDPAHARAGLAAARAYASIAPDAPHAQHMTSHIFLALGLWDDVVRANEVAVAATGRTPAGCGHYPEWLAYGYLQQHRADRAGSVLAPCQRMLGMAGMDEIEGFAGMRAAYLVDADEPGVFLPEPAARDPGSRAYLAFGTGFVAARRGDRAALRESLERARRAVQAIAPRERAYPEILVLELTALTQAADSDFSAATATARRAAQVDDSLPVPFGPPLTVKPPRELLADLLARGGRFADAAREYESALARTPRRRAALVGLAAALDRAGNAAGAAAIRDTVAAISR